MDTHVADYCRLKDSAKAQRLISGDGPGLPQAGLSGRVTPSHCELAGPAVKVKPTQAGVVRRCTGNLLNLTLIRRRVMR